MYIFRLLILAIVTSAMTLFAIIQAVASFQTWKKERLIGQSNTKNPKRRFYLSIAVMIVLAFILGSLGVLASIDLSSVSQSSQNYITRTAGNTPKTTLVVTATKTFAAQLTPTVTPTFTSTVTTTPSSVSDKNIHDWLVSFCDAVLHNPSISYNYMTDNLKANRVLDGSTYIQCKPTYIHIISSTYIHCIVQMTTNDGAKPYDRYISVTGSDSTTWKISEWYTNSQKQW